MKITFFNSVPEKFGEYTLHRSTTEKSSIIKTFNTDNSRRAMAFAKRYVKRARILNAELGHNVRIETVCANPSYLNSDK